MTEAKPVPVKVTIDEATAQGHYVNFANILHNPTEFVLDFGRAVPGRPDVKVVSRILTTPYHAKQLLRALRENIELYERAYGEIRSDFPVPVPGSDGHEDELASGPDHSPAQHQVPRVEDAGLPGRDRADRRVEDDARRGVGAGRDGRGRLGRAVTNRGRPRGTGPPAPPRTIAVRRPRPRAASSAGPGTHDDAIARSIDRQDVEALGRGDADAAPLADRVAEVPGVGPQTRSRRVLDGAARRGQGQAQRPACPATNSPARVPAGTKQISWLSSLSAVGRPAPRARARTSLLVSPPTGKRAASSCSSVRS